MKRTYVIMTGRKRLGTIDATTAQRALVIAAQRTGLPTSSLQARPVTRNGIVEAAAGLQALEYIGGKVRPRKVGRVRPLRNPAPSEWDDEEFTDEELNEASRQGWLGAQAMKREHAKRAAGPKYFNVTWYSSLKKKRVGFIRPIEAHNATDAKRQGKAMVENDPKASNFIAKEVTRNPKEKSAADLLVMQLTAQRAQSAAEAAKQRHGYGSPKHLAAETAYKTASQRYQRAKAKAARRNPEYEVEATPKVRAKTVRVKALTHGGAVRKAKRQLGPHKKAYELSVKRVNPSTTEMSKRFNGEANGDIEQAKAANGTPGNLSRAGKLVFLKLVNRRAQLRIPGAVVCIDPRTERLWIVGNRTPLLNRRAQPGQRLDVGELDAICYETAKRHIEKGRLTEYVHTFGEDGGRKPHLHIDHEGMPLIVGGDYTIRKEGIVN